MKRAPAFLAAVIAAILIAFVVSRPPSPKGANAAATDFSAARAMTDVRAIARAPHPTGSAENARVRAYLMDRLRGLGLAVSTQRVPLEEKALKRLGFWSGADAASVPAVNIVGLLPGRDRSRPAILLMAHYDTVWASPGAPDDSAGVAVALEIVRALKAGPPPARDLIILFTDAEELGLDGARGFFNGNPLAAHVGAAVNLESRGGGGRAIMFETGADNGALIELYRRSVAHPFANSLAVFVYKLLPNDTDFTIPREKGINGFNFAFSGKSSLYHSPLATPDRLDPAPLQHMGGQALAVTRALVTAEKLPPRAPDAVFGDVLGLFVIAYPAAIGWAVLAISAGLLLFASARARGAGMRLGEIGGGIAAGLALALHAVLLLGLVNLLSGAGPEANYYDRLAALPRLEAQTALLCAVVFIAVAMTARPARRWLTLVPAVVLTGALLLFGGWSPVLVGIGLVAAATAFFAWPAPANLWGGWLGLCLLVFVLALAAQFAAPAAGAFLAWPLVLASAMAAAVAFADPKREGRLQLWLFAIPAAIGLAQLLSLAHITFQSLGADTPGALGIFLLLAGLFLWPLAPAGGKKMRWTAMLFLIVAVGLALWVRLDPIAPSVPPYSIS